MKTHTSQFKEDIKTVGKQLDSKITFKVDGVTQTLTSEDLNGVTPTFQGAILKSVMKELDIDSNVNIPIGTEVNYQFGVKLENDFEYLDYGNYIVYSSEKQEDTSSYKIICYDKMLYSMKQNEDLGITYPISIRDYINALCTKIGLEFKNKNDEFANFDRVLDKELYVGLDYTYRDILDELAQVTASTICLDNKDKVEIRYINDLTELNEVVGTNVNINDSIDYKLNSLTLYGNSTQETSEQSANLFDEDYYRNATYTNNVYRYTLSKIKGGRRLYVKAKLKEGKSAVSGIYVCLSTNPNPNTSGSQYQWFINNGNTPNASFNPATFTDYLYFSFYPTTTTLPQIFDNYNLWVSTDNINYEPFVPDMPSPDYPSPIESITEISATVTGKNLFDKDNCISGSYLSNLGQLLGSSTFNITEYIPVIPNAEYTISGITSSGSNPSYCFYDKGKNFISGETHKGYLGEKTITIPANCYYFRDSINNVDIDTYQFEKGTQATSWEEYKSNTLTIDLQGNELCSLPNGTKDEVVIENGIAKIIKKIGKVVLDGSENWAEYVSQTSDGYRVYTTAYRLGLTGTLSYDTFLSNYFQAIPFEQKNSINLTKYATYLNIDNTIANTVAGVKAWLSTHNVEVLYELAEPETVNLGIVEMLHTYNGVSNIANSADTEMIVKYSKGWETINEEYLKDINVNFGQKYGPVNSVVLTRGAESDNIYLQDENSIAQNGLCEIKIADNQIMNWNDRSDYLPDILEKLDGLEYYLNDFSSTGIAYLDLCDRYNIEVFENTYSCVMFNDELLVTQGLEENVHTDMPEETETDYTKADKTDRKINNVSLIVDKQEQKINALAEKIQDISNTISGTGVITLTECNQTPLYKLVITGDDSLLFSNNKLFPSATTYLKSSTLYVNKGTDYEAIYDLKIPALRTLGNVKDEYIMENGKAKLIKRIGLNNNLQKYVLDTPIETDLGEMIINLKEGENTLEMPSFPAFRHTATYLLQNEYTDVFASQAQVTSQINIASDEILIESKSQILESGDELIASINTTSTGKVKIKASDTIALEGTTTVGDKIIFNLDGSITAQDLRLLDGGKVIGGDGLLTSMQFESVGQYNGFQFLGFNYNANNEVYKTSVSTTFNIPENFVVVSAYATLLHTPINFWDFNNTSITGSAKNLKLYKDFSANVDKIYAGFNSGYWIENNNLNGDEITNAFGSATYTPANSQSGILVSKTSIDIKDYISTGLNTLFVRTIDSTSSTSSNSTDACKKTGCAKLIIQVIGYTNFK